MSRFRNKKLIVLYSVLVAMTFGNVFLQAGCKKKDKKKVEAEKKEADKGVKEGGKGVPPKGFSSKGEKPFTEKFKLPAQADAVLYFNFVGLRGHEAWKDVFPLLKQVPLVELLSKTCEMDVLDVVDHIAMAVSFHSRDTLTVLEGKKLEGAKVLACLQKTVKNGDLEGKLKVSPPGKRIKGAEGGQATTAKEAVREGAEEAAKTAKGAKGVKAAKGAKGDKEGKGEGGGDKKKSDAKPKPQRLEGEKGGPEREVSETGALDVRFTQDDSVFVFRVSTLGPNRLAVSQGAWVGSARELNEGKKTSLGEDSHIIKLRDTLASANLFWAVSLGLPPIKSGIPNIAALQKIRSIAVGVNSGEGLLELKVSADMREEKAAKSLAGVLSNILPGIGKYSPDLEQIGALLEKIKITAKGPVLKLSLKLEKEGIKILHRKTKGIISRFVGKK